MKKAIYAATLMAIAIFSSCKKDDNSSNNNNNNNPIDSLTENTFVVDGTTYTVCTGCSQTSYNNGHYAWEWHDTYTSKFVKINFPTEPVESGTYQIEARGTTGSNNDDTWGSVPAAGKVQIWFVLETSMTGGTVQGFDSYDGSAGAIKATVNTDGTIKIQFTDITVRNVNDAAHIVKASGNYTCK